jgi:hypothetical protein
VAKAVIIAVLLGCGAVPIAAAERAPVKALQQFLAKRFRPSRGVFGAIASAIPVNLDPNSIAGMEGAKPDGSYWTSAFFNTGNVRMFDDPRIALAKFCATSGGVLERVQPFALSARHEFAFGSFELRDARGSFRVPSAVLGQRIAAGIDRHAGIQTDTYGPFTNERAAQVDGKGSLGLFACTSAGNAIWQIAILPTMAGAWRAFATDGRLSGDQAVMLSVREVDRALVERVQVTIAALRQAEKTSADDVARANAARRAEKEAKVLQALPALRRFQAAVIVGDDTNCGLVLAVNGPLVEVQVPDTVKLENGASRLFVKRNLLSPRGSAHACYDFDIFSRRWSLAAPPMEALNQ